MNKLVINESAIELQVEDQLLEITLSDKLDIFDVKKIKIKFIKDTTLEIVYHNKGESKLDIIVEVEPNVNAILKELKEEHKTKIQYHYFLEKNSHLDVFKFYDCYELKELDVVTLTDQYAVFNYQFKTIAHKKQKIDMVVYHNHKNTTSNINVKGLTIEDGAINLNLTGVVYHTIVGCELNQNSHIINLNNKKSQINPNLLIEEEDVVANHAAYIGNFKEEQFFYLQSRGIPYNKALNLLIKGFLFDESMNPEVNKIIETHWR